MKAAVCLLVFAAAGLQAQEASAGFDLRGTVSGEAMFGGALSDRSATAPPMDAGVRSVLYPTLKLDEHWTIQGAFQVISRPYFREDIDSAGHGIRGRILQANIGYSKVWSQGYVTIRAGQLSTAFGAFLLRYDDADNPLPGMPLIYGYYYQPITTLGMPAVQADVTLRRWDARLQLANSSPANPRTLFQKDQYGNWAGGLGYTIRQGFRIGVSGYRGPYLYRGYKWFLPGESNPSRLPATAAGVDGAWALAHWNVNGEWQKFVLPYHAMPTFRETAGYLEIKRTLHPRWYVAARAGYTANSAHSGAQLYEGAAGFRPNASQLLKVGYELMREGQPGEVDHAVIVQFVTQFHAPPLAWNRAQQR